MADKIYLDGDYVVTEYEKPITMQIVDRDGNVLIEEKVQECREPIKNLFKHSGDNYGDKKYN